MIEIVKEEVEMPDMDKRRYQRGKCIDRKGWEVIDTARGNICYKGTYIMASIALHNFNKKHYLTKK